MWEFCSGTHAACSGMASALQCKGLPEPTGSPLTVALHAGFWHPPSPVFHTHIGWSATQPAPWCYGALQFAQKDVGLCIQHSWLCSQDIESGRLRDFGTVSGLLASKRAWSSSISAVSILNEWLGQWFCLIVSQGCQFLCPYIAIAGSKKMVMVFLLLLLLDSERDVVELKFFRLFGGWSGHRILEETDFSPIPALLCLHYRETIPNCCILAKWIPAQTASLYLSRATAWNFIMSPVSVGFVYQVVYSWSLVCTMHKSRKD